MATVARMTTKRNVTHYAYYGEHYGTAELVNGSGYLFKQEGERKATLVSYKDPELLLLGLCDVADGQHDVDQLVGGPARIACTRQMEVK